MENYIKIRPKVLIKSIAIILTTIIILQLFPAIVFGIQQSNTLQDDTNVVEDGESNTSNNSTEIVGEIIEKRTLNQKHFLQEDGNIITTIYPSNIHYEENGQLVDINNSLEETTEDEGIYKNKNNSFEVKFAKKSNKNNLAKLKIQNHNVKWSLQNSNKVNATKLNNEDETEEKFKLKNISSGTIQYENILEGIDLQYNIISNSIKENIILKNKTSIEQQLVFEFNTGNLNMEKMEDGRIIFYEKDKEEVLFFLEAPFMYDSKNEMSDDIEVKLEGKNNKYTLTLIPNKEWLEEEKREYPVIIDPTVETSLNYQNIQDTYIFDGDSGYPNRHNAHILRVGSNNTLASKNPIRSLIKFTLPELNAGDQVISAMLDICTYPDTDEWAPPTETIQIDVHKMTENWDALTASWSNLNTKYDTRITDYAKYQFDTNNQAKFYYFDITSIVKDWYVTGNNYGVVLKDHTEIYDASRSDAYFFSADVNQSYINARPMVQIVYRNQTGLEDYQTYHTQTVGRAGTVYTNDYNGNLVLIHNDAQTPGNLLPVTISHIYNTNDKDGDWGYGKGFKLNLSQMISNETIGGSEYARYWDEDGTKHYFRKNGNNYIDEDNLGLTLTFENDIYYLKDKENNKLKFVKKQLGTGYIWHLKELEDSYNNKIIIDLIDDQYVGARISKVTDAVGNSITITYNSYNRLSTIEDVSGRITSYSYNSQGNVVNIKYHDNEQSIYNYNSLNLLTSIYNIDNLHVNYEYYNEKSNRVKSIKEYSTQNEIGNSINISYGNNATIFTDNRGYSNTYTFNNAGQTISISDFGKSNNNVDNAYGKTYTYGENENNKNRLTLESQLISISEMENNLVLNSKFDNGLENWTQYQNETGDGIVDGSIKINGNANLDKNIYQTKLISGKKGDIYTFGGWVKTNGVPNSDDKVKNVNITIYVCRTDNTIQSIEKQANTDGSTWQFVWDEFVTDSDYKWIRIHLVNNKNANETYFDNVGLFKEEYGQSYTYDSNGNLVSAQDNAKNENTFKYDVNNNLITAINPTGGKFTYEYDNENTTKLLNAVNSLGNEYKFEYDSYGNNTSIKVEESGLLNVIQENTPYYLQFVSSSKYMEVVNSSNENNANIQQNSLNQNLNQMFTFYYLEDGYYKIIINHNINKVLDVDMPTLNVQQWNDVGVENQKWKIIKCDDDTYKIVCKAQGEDYCLTVQDNSLSDGGNIILAKDENKTNQRIKVYSVIDRQDLEDINKETDTIQNNETYYIKMKSSQNFLEIEGQSFENNANLETNVLTGLPNQKFTLYKIDDEYYKIALNHDNTKVLDVDMTSLNVQQWNDVGVENQKWKIIEADDGTYKLICKAKGNDYCLTTEDNGNLIIALDEEKESQRVYFYNVKEVNLQNRHLQEDASKKYIISQAEYSSNGGYQTKLIDELGNSAQYEYNQNTGTLLNTIDAKNSTTSYTYDIFDRLKTVTKILGEKSYTNTYTYKNDMLETITHNGFSYTFVYDNFNNIKQTKVGNQVLATNNYEGNNGNLASVTYGNNQTISYNYDRFNRLTKTIGTNGNYQYTYDAKSNIKTIVDSINNNIETFTYDLADRLVKSINTNGFTKEYGYDINNNTNTYKYTLTERKNELEYNYDKANRLTNIKLNNNITWSNIMDRLSRLSSNKITSGSNNYTTSYTYVDVEDVTNKTTTLLETIKNGNNDEIAYTYDVLGNIETIKRGNSLTNKYYYDELNQLIRENDVGQNKTITYEYDLGGNLLNKKEYTYTESETLPETPDKTTTYTYTNTNWKDQLTEYDGKQITYDEIGNPLTYDGNIYTWQNGRQLAGISNSSKNQTITYKYNDSGIRTQKTVNGITTDYYLDGTKVIYEKTGNNVIYYTYDENGRVIGLKYNDTQYYYIRNGQNDIIGILDSNLNQVVSYEYDSWGNILSIKDANGNDITDSTNIGLINPYRYRSYRYDTETGLYYLQSRYYNPEWGRFINADNYGGQVGELLSHNGYAYCKNNPINMLDENGNSGTLTIAIFAFLVVAVMITTIPQETWTDLAEAVTTTVTGIVESVTTGISKITTKNETKTTIKTTTKTKNKEKNNYWQAELVTGNLVIGKPLSFSEAKDRVAQGQSIMCSNNMAAWGIAKNYPARVLDPPHKGDGYYWHYHINKNAHNNIHIWFYGNRTVLWD